MPASETRLTNSVTGDVHVVSTETGRTLRVERRIIEVPPDTDVEIDLEPCQCPAGHVCPDADPFAAECPRRPRPAGNPED